MGLFNKPDCSNEDMKNALRELIREEMDSFYNDTLKAVSGLNKKVDKLIKDVENYANATKVITVKHQLTDKKEKSVKKLTNTTEKSKSERTFEDEVRIASNAIPNSSLTPYLKNLKLEDCIKYKSGKLRYCELMAAIGAENTTKVKTSWNIFTKQLAINTGGVLNSKTKRIEGGKYNFHKYRTAKKK